MKIIENHDPTINFDLISYYRNLSKCNNEIEKIKIEANYFNFYDSLEKEKQFEFKKLDKKVRLTEAKLIRKEINSIAKMLIVK